MSRTPCCSSFFGIGSWPHSGRPGAPCGPALCSTSTLSLSTTSVGIVDARGHVVVVLEHHGRPGMAREMRLHRRRLDHRAVRREVAAQHRETVALDERIASRTDHVVVVDGRALEVLAERLRVDGQRGQVEEVGQTRHQPAQAARVVEVLHQVLARRPHVRQHGRAARERVEAVEVEIARQRAARWRSGARSRWSSRRAPVPWSPRCRSRALSTTSRIWRSSHTISTMRLPDSVAICAVTRVRRGDRRGAGQRQAHRLGRAASSSTPCPSSCSGRASARCRLPRRASRLR